VRIRRTFELNTKNQTFGCTLSLLTWWYTNEDASFPKDMPQDIPSNVAGALSDWTPKWRPQIAIKNVMRGARPAECTYALIKNPKFKEGNAVRFQGRSPPSTAAPVGLCLWFAITPEQDSWQNPMKYIVLADERHYVHIYSHFNLASFPLDIQQFKIELELRGADCSLLCFVPYDQCGDVDFDDGVTTADCFPGRCVFEDMSLVPPEDLTDQEVAKGWTMYQPPDAPVPHLRYRLYNSDPKDSRQGESYSSLTVELRYCRRPFYYILNVATIMLIIGTRPHRRAPISSGPPRPPSVNAPVGWSAHAFMECGHAAGTLALSTWGISENSGRLKPLFTLLLCAFRAHTLSTHALRS
jgi:hypothetical protein